VSDARNIMRTDNEQARVKLRGDGRELAGGFAVTHFARYFHRRLFNVALRRLLTFTRRAWRMRADASRAFSPLPRRASSLSIRTVADGRTGRSRRSRRL
jgi:hypothetical protein